MWVKKQITDYEDVQVYVSSNEYIIFLSSCYDISYKNESSYVSTFLFDQNEILPCFIYIIYELFHSYLILFCQGFGKDWHNGKAFCALIHKVRLYCFNIYKLECFIVSARLDWRLASERKWWGKYQESDEWCIQHPWICIHSVFLFVLAAEHLFNLKQYLVPADIQVCKQNCLFVRLICSKFTCFEWLISVQLFGPIFSLLSLTYPAARWKEQQPAASCRAAASWVTVGDAAARWQQQ